MDTLYTHTLILVPLKPFTLCKKKQKKLYASPEKNNKETPTIAKFIAIKWSWVRGQGMQKTKHKDKKNAN